MSRLATAILLKSNFLLHLAVFGALASPQRRDFCGESLYLEPGQVRFFTSPGFPDPYPNGADCNWAVEAPSGSSISLSCPFFDLSPSSDCADDSFYVSQNGLTYCGSSNVDVTSDVNEFSVRFTSQNFYPNEHLGFVCLVSVTGNSPSSTTVTYGTDNTDHHFQTVNTEASSATETYETELITDNFQTDKADPSSTTLTYGTEGVTDTFQTDKVNPSSTTGTYGTEHITDNFQTDKVNPSSTTGTYETGHTDYHSPSGNTVPSSTTSPHGTGNTDHHSPSGNIKPSSTTVPYGTGNTGYHFPSGNTEPSSTRGTYGSGTADYHSQFGTTNPHSTT
ncbi:uncharacterized protein [Macrobrachium rosenbergii]|uniref:uncharacterized protein n=1 Tax=Macrobrachium rosenbergii TaxID=79674 RepID=UPI0034D4250D